MMGKGLREDRALSTLVTVAMRRVQGRSQVAVEEKDSSSGIWG